MMTSSPGFVLARSDAIMASVEPQQTVISVSGSMATACQSCIWRAMAARRWRLPQVIAYWLMSLPTACWAARFISSGAGKSGKPWARFTAWYFTASRDISRITDSEKWETFSLRKDLGEVMVGSFECQSLEKPGGQRQARLHML